MLLFRTINILAVLATLLIAASPLSAGNLAVASQSKPAEIESYPSPIGGFQVLSQAIVYPESAKKSGLSGKVLLSVSFDNQGRVANVTVKESLGAEFDKAAIDAVKKVQWKPAMAGGKPVACDVMLPVKFKLDNKKNKK